MRRLSLVLVVLLGTAACENRLNPAAPSDQARLQVNPSASTAKVGEPAVISLANENGYVAFDFGYEVIRGKEYLRSVSASTYQLVVVGASPGEVEIKFFTDRASARATVRFVP